MFSTKIIELDNAKFPKSISSENFIWREFVEIDSVTVCFQKWLSQKHEFYYPFFSQ